MRIYGFFNAITEGKIIFIVATNLLESVKKYKLFMFFSNYITTLNANMKPLEGLRGMTMKPAGKNDSNFLL